MGQISNDPTVLMKSVYNGCWICNKGEHCLIYDGTGSGFYEGEYLETILFNSLFYMGFISKDSANHDFSETFYHFNTDFDLTNKVILNEILSQLKYRIGFRNYKEKYKHLLREIKLERIIND